MNQKCTLICMLTSVRPTYNFKLKDEAMTCHHEARCTSSLTHLERLVPQPRISPEFGIRSHKLSCMSFTHNFNGGSKHRGRRMAKSSVHSICCVCVCVCVCLPPLPRSCECGQCLFVEGWSMSEGPHRI